AFRRTVGMQCVYHFGRSERSCKGSAEIYSNDLISGNSLLLRPCRCFNNCDHNGTAVTLNLDQIGYVIFMTMTQKDIIGPDGSHINIPGKAIGSYKRIEEQMGALQFHSDRRMSVIGNFHSRFYFMVQVLLSE